MKNYDRILAVISVFLLPNYETQVKYNFAFKPSRILTIQQKKGKIFHAQTICKHSNR